jgi:hypothetical protein
MNLSGYNAMKVNLVRWLSAPFERDRVAPVLPRGTVPARTLPGPGFI